MGKGGGDLPPYLLKVMIRIKAIIVTHNEMTLRSLRM